MDSSCESSVTEWIESLHRGSGDAAQKIWQRYIERLVREADRCLKALPRRSADEQDIAQEAFACFFRAVEAGRFPNLDDRDDLWQVLAMLADRRAKDQMRRELADRRNGGKVRDEAALSPPSNQSASGAAGFDQFESPDVTPASAEELIRLIETSFPNLQDEVLQQIALDRAQAYTNEEIAQRRGMSLRGVERKIHLIRSILERSFDEGPA